MEVAQVQNTTMSSMSRYFLLRKEGDAEQLRVTKQDLWMLVETNKKSKEERCTHNNYTMTTSW